MPTADPPGLIDRLRALDPERYARRLAPAGAALCLLAAALGSWYGLLPAALGLSLLLVSCLSRDDGLLVLGPFVRYELVRASRRRFPPALFRASYAAAALALLGLIYLNVTSYGAWRQTRAQQMEQVAVAFFSLFAGIQFLYLAVLTIILIAPVVAEEREAKRLDFLLVTDLRNREILLGKAVGRLPQLLDPALASLPILALLPFFGGVPPGFVIAAALATCATVIGLAGVSFFGSIIAPNPTKASDFAVGLGFAYLMLSGLPWLLALLPSTWAFPSSLGFRSPVELGDLVRLWSSGNIFAAVVDTGRAIVNTGADPETTILRAARAYSVFWLGVGSLFGLMAVSRLRTAKVLIPADPKLGQPTGAETGPAATPRRPVNRPPVWDEPVLWYEMYRSPAPLGSPDWQKEIGRYAILGVVLVVVLHLVSHVIPGPPRDVARGFIGLAAWGLSFGTMVGAAVRGNTTVARERQAGTLDGLMLTGLGCREILRQKWLGCVGGLIGICGVLLGALAAGLLSLSLHPVSAAVILLATPVHAAFGASFGMVCGVGAKTVAAAGRDLVLAVVVALFFGAAVAVSLIPEGAAPVVGPAAIPPAATGLLTMAPLTTQSGPRRGPSGPPVGAMLAGAAIGTVLYAGLAVLLWRAAVRRFEREWEPRQ